MEEYQIYCIDNSDLSEFEAKNKGYRNDIYVKIDRYIYILNIYNIVRLTQDYELEYNDYGYYDIEPNIIIVHEVTFQEIKKTIGKLFKQGYFDRIKSLDENVVNQLSLKDVL